MPSSFKVTIPKELAPDEVFTDMPQTFRRFLSRGFEQVAQLDQSKISLLANLIVEGNEAMEEAGITEILRRLEIQVQDKSSFGPALGVLTIIITSRDDMMDVISAGEKAGVIPSASSGRIKEIASELARSKEKLKDILELRSLANAVAPSFQRFRIATELRFAFEESKVVRTVPVAICYISTDSDEHDFFFQMTKSDITQLILQLKKVEGELSAIESWSKERK